MNEKKKEKKIPVEVYSRVVGYYRPVSQWNRGKQEEFAQRGNLNPREVISSLDKHKDDGFNQ